MNGPEHYAEAERLLRMYEDSSSPTHQDWAAQWGSQVLASAQVHATLAQAAAAIDAQRGGMDVWQAWPAPADRTDPTVTAAGGEGAGDE